MYAFLAHASACEALRFLEDPLPTWPPQARKLPLSGECVSTQRAFKELKEQVDLSSFGVWSTPVDMIVPTQSMRSRGKHARFHVWSGPVPAASMLRCAENVLVSGPELVIAQLCGSHSKLDALLEEHVRAVRAEQEVIGTLDVDAHPVLDHPLKRSSIERFVSALVLACEFAGTYRLGANGGATTYHARRLMTTKSLNAVIAQLDGTSNRTRAAEVAGLLYEGSASPMETAIALLLTLPANLGGMGLPHAELNTPVDVSKWHGTLSDRDTVTPDMQWRALRVAIEYDSAEFHERLGPSRLEKDARRANILTSC